MTLSPVNQSLHFLSSVASLNKASKCELPAHTLTIHIPYFAHHGRVYLKCQRKEPGTQQECYPLIDKTCQPLLPGLLFCSWTFHAGESVERDHRAKTGLDSRQTPLKMAYSHWSRRTTIRPTDYSPPKPLALSKVMLSGTSESSQLPGNQKLARPELFVQLLCC